MSLTRRDIAKLQAILDQTLEEIGNNADVVMKIAERGEYTEDWEKIIATQCIKSLIGMLKIRHEEAKLDDFLNDG